jgi:methionyl-tRNA formyltransferase
VTRLKLIFAGSGEFGLPTLRALLGSCHEVVQVVTQPDRPAGRGRGLAPTPIARAAIEAKVPLLRTENINQETLAAADLMVVIAFGQKISEAQVNHARLGSINLHASRLPRHRGAAPINWAIINGDPITGNSVIRLAQKMDAGAILAQSELAIGELETAGELHHRLAQDGVHLVLQAINDLSLGSAVERAQKENESTSAPKLTRQSARLDFARPAAELARQIRGLYPWPGCRVRVQDVSGKELDRLRLVRARARADEAPPVSLAAITESGMIQTANGAIELVECQREGGRPMKMADYRRGHRWEAGLRMESLD